MARDRLAALKAQQPKPAEEENFPQAASKPSRPRLSSRASFEDSYEVYNYKSPSPEAAMAPFTNPFAEQGAPQAPAAASPYERRPSEDLGTPKASQMSFASPARSGSRHSSPFPRRGSIPSVVRSTSTTSQRRGHTYQTSTAHVQFQEPLPTFKRTQEQLQESPVREHHRSNSLSSLSSVGSAAPPYTPDHTATKMVGDNEKVGLGIFDAVDTTMEAFFEELGKIQSETREYEDALTRIETLHARELSTIAESNEANRVAAEFSRVHNEANRLSASLKRRIQQLERTNGLGKDLAPQEKTVKRTQTAGAKNRFISAIQRYSSIETEHRVACRQRLTKQFKIVNPNATDLEIRQACEATDGGIFTPALIATARNDAARAALSAVHARQADLARLEHTISELGQLFNDMAYMVEEQQDQVEQVETTAQKSESDMEAARVSLQAAKDSASSARMRRFAIILATFIGFLVLVIVILLIVKSRGVFDRADAPTVTQPSAQLNISPRAIRSRIARAYWAAGDPA